MQGIDRTLLTEGRQIEYDQKNIGKLLCFHHSFIPSLYFTILFRAMLPFSPILFAIRD